jgi:phosphatidylglycerophosphate synthase
MLDNGATTLRVAPGPLTAAGAQVAILAALAETVGLGPAGWIVGLASGLILNQALARALQRDPVARLGAASWVTLARATLAVGVAALAADSIGQNTAVAPLVTLASIAIALDYVDGWIARRTGTTSALGAWLDGEVDAFLIFALSVEVASSVGVWVLAIGAARYAFLAAGWLLPWMRAQLPRRDWRKVVAATQGIALTIAAAGVLPPGLTSITVAVALALLAESFGRDVWWLWRNRHSAAAEITPARDGHPLGAVLTVLAAVVFWAALVAPNQPWHLTLGAFVRLPLEGIVLVVLAVVLPSRARRVLPWVIGPALGLLVLVKLLDFGFFTAFDRPFNPVDDWAYASIGVETVRDTFGRTDADLAVVGFVLLALAALILPTLAVHRVTRVAAGHPRQSLQAMTALAAVWSVCWLFGADLVPGTSIASTSAAGLAVHEVNAVKTDLRNQARFTAELRHDPFAGTPSDRLLAALRGKDVLLVFVEGYGKLTLQGSPFAPGVDALVDAGTRQLATAGFSARSSWIISPGFGGASWLAQSTLQSGTWVNTQGRYNELVASKRLTLTKAFGLAGWRTVADMPANDRDWSVGPDFYHFDKTYDRRNVGYKGPKYAYASMPDQFMLLALQRLELAKPHRRPVFAEVATVSSHAPWTRVPPLIAWNRVGNGSIFNRLPVNESGLTDSRQGYVQSICYSLRTLFSFVQHYGNKNLVLVVLGDEQPARIASGQPGHQVPISIIAHDPAVMRQISGWGWVDGLRPTQAAPVWDMNAFRNRFLSAFDA